MIRDPSDGSVRDVPSKTVREQPGTAPSRLSPQSGLAPLDKDQNDAARLKRSREQLENYKRTGVWK